jgi:chemotaxis family two-component system response regulator Rcp1
MDSIKLTRSVNILVVEDSPGDVRLIREALRDSQFAVHLSVARDGEEALSLLMNGKNGLVPLPDLVLLDLNLPKKSGREVLSEIKHDALLKKVPVIVMTSSNSEDDISAVYRLNANCYIRKPSDLYQYERVVRAIEDFWLMTVMLPDYYGPTGSSVVYQGAHPTLQ